jgi:hypothetical protein
MATPVAFYGENQTLSYGAGPTVLAHITDVTYSGDKVDDLETTDTLSTGGYTTFIPGWKTAGEVTTKCIYYPGDTTQEGIEAIKDTIVAWVHTLPNSLGVIKFNGFVTNYTKVMPMKKTSEFTLKVKITGSAVWSAS